MSFRRGLGAIVVLALVARIVIVLATPDFKAVADGGDFDRIAVSLADHGRFPRSYLAPTGGPTAFRPPLFPIALAGVYELSGTSSASSRWEAGRIFEAVLGAIAVLLIGLIAERLSGRRVALIAAAIAAVYPPLWLVGSSLLSESLFIPIMLASVLAALIARDSSHRVRWSIASGLLAGLAALTRGNGIVLLVPLMLLVWGTPPRSLRALRAPAALLGATIAMLIPWTVRNAEQFHEFVPLTTETGYALAGVYNPIAQSDPTYPALWGIPAPEMSAYFRERPSANEAQVSDHLTSNALHYIGQHPGSILRTAFWSVARALNFTGTGIEQFLAPYQGWSKGLAVASVFAFWLLLAVAVAATIAGAAKRLPWALWTWPLVVVLSCVIFAGDTRYRSPCDPFFILVAAAGLSWAVDRRRARLRSATA